MAIGKVNAYATVQAPNVDFGEIALNAQKFQDADIEKQKELKVAQLKAEKVTPVELKLPELKNTSTVGSYDETKYQVVEQSKTDIAEITYKENNIYGPGKLPIELQVRRANLMANATQIDSNLANVRKGAEDYVKKIPLFSGVGNDKIDVVAAAMKKDAEHFIGDDGKVHYRVYVKNSDGTKTIKTFSDRGVIKDSITDDDIQSGDIFNNILATDVTAEVNKLQGILKLDKFRTDNGVVSIDTQTKNRPDFIIATDAAITASLGPMNVSNDKLIDILYKTGDPKYKTVLKEYTQEDYNKAKDFIKTQVWGGIPEISEKNVSTPSAIALRKEGQEQEKYKYTIGRSSHAQGELGGSISRDVEKTSFGFPLIRVPMVSVKAGNYFNKKGEAGKIPLPPGSYFTDMTLIQRGNKEIPAFVVQQLDAKSSREVQNKINDLDFGSMNPDQQQEATNIILSSYGNKYTQHIYTFSKEDSDNILKQQTLGANKGAGYNTQFAIETLRNAQPKEKVNNTQNTKQISSKDFNAKWSKLKSGEKLVGPDGKTYTKS